MAPPFLTRPSATSRARFPSRDWRMAKASAASSRMRERVLACSLAGKGLPMTTPTGRGKCLGNFQKDFPPLKLKMEPHMPSIATGTMGAPPRRAISSKPLRSCIRPPLRVRLPSGKMQTISPRARASPDLMMASFAFVSETGIVPIRRHMKPRNLWRSKPSQERKRTGRRHITPITSTSA